MSVEDYVERALAARSEQGLPAGIEDDATLHRLAELLSTPPTRRSRPVARAAPPTPDHAAAVDGGSG
jgi:hypothetical protein